MRNLTIVSTTRRTFQRSKITHLNHFCHVLFMLHRISIKKFPIILSKISQNFLFEGGTDGLLNRSARLQEVVSPLQSQNRSKHSWFPSGSYVGEVVGSSVGEGVGSPEGACVGGMSNTQTYKLICKNHPKRTKPITRYIASAYFENLCQPV